MQFRPDATAIAVAVHDADRAAHGSADGDAHRDPVVRADGCAFVWADIPAFGRYYLRTDRGAHCGTDRGAHRGADLQADGRGDRGAELRDVGPHDCAAELFAF